MKQPKLTMEEAKRRTLELAAKKRARNKERAEAFATLSAEERQAYILGPQTPPTEFEVQAYVYHHLLRLGYAVRGEVGTRCGTCRFDLVVYQNGRPARVIEIKKQKRAAGNKFVKRATRRENRNQLSRYSEFGLPVDTVCGMAAARGYIAALENGGGFSRELRLPLVAAKAD